MIASMFDTIVTTLSTLLIGVVSAFVSFVTPLQEAFPQFIQRPNPTPIIIESPRMLTPEEQTTMSASFINDFQILIASGTGNRK